LLFDGFERDLLMTKGAFCVLSQFFGLPAAVAGSISFATFLEYVNVALWASAGVASVVWPAARTSCGKADLMTIEAAGWG
jgi:hypothetical protein